MMRCSLTTLISILLLKCAVVTAYAQAGVPWYPFPVEVQGRSIDGETEKNIAFYSPLKTAQKTWRICTSFPHMKDSYWLAVNFGVVSEASRLGINLEVHEAGGYDHLQTQLQQIRKCVEEGSNGVIIGAISYKGLDDLVEELHNKGIPVIDVINGMSSSRVAARSLVSFEEMGFSAGAYLAQLHATSNSPAKVAWFPGPEDAGWVLAGDWGFQKALMGSDVNIVAKRYGDTGKLVQTALLNEVLDMHPDIDYIVGTAVTASAAIKVLRARGLSDQVKILAYYFTPEVYRGIKRGQIVGAPTDSAVIQGRIAVDQLVRVLEKKTYIRHVGPEIYVVDQKNINALARLTSLAPSGFRATYSVGVRLKGED
jgi:protein TorT